MEVPFGTQLFYLDFPGRHEHQALPRGARNVPGGYVCHARATARLPLPLFAKSADDAAFERVLALGQRS